MPRCTHCGRRYRALPPRCGHDTSTPEPPIGPAPAPRVTGYEVDRYLGSGGFGDVFALRSTVSGERVAIKVCRTEQPRARRRFHDEVEVLRRIGPPAVPRVIAEGALDGGEPYVVMELLGGQSLDHWLSDRAEPPPIAEVLEVAVAIAGALERVHSLGIVHRDLKPENVFVVRADGRATARLIDFGLARLGTAEPDERLTRAGDVVGTTDYMAPEQCVGAQVDARADLYSLGVILYEALTGRAPFYGTPAEVRRAHTDRRPTPLSEVADVPHGIETLVMQCLAKDPAHRPATASELRRRIDACALEGSAGTTGTAARPPARARRAAETRMLSLLFFESDTDQGAIEAAVGGCGGRLAYLRERRRVYVFGDEVSENPVRAAVRAGRTAIDLGICDRAVVDAGNVRVREKRTGDVVFLSKLFSDDSRYPRAGDPSGVSLTPAAEALAAEPSRAPLIGRDDHLETLADRACEWLDSGTAGVATVIGDAGMGKTRLAAALCDRVRRAVPATTVVAVRAVESLGGDPDASTRELLRELLPDAPGDRAALRAVLGAERGDRLWPAYATVLGIEVDPDEVAAIRAAPGALGQLAVKVVGEVIVHRSRAGPLMVVVDDAHWAAPSLLSGLEYAARHREVRAVAAVVLARPEFSASRPLWGRGVARTIAAELGPLDGPSASELAAHLLLPAERVPAAVVDAITRRAGGNPLFLHELVRGLKRDGIVRKNPTSRRWYVAADELETIGDLPVVSWLASRALADLAPAAAAHARLVSLQVPEFQLDELRGVVDQLVADGLGSEFPLDAAAGVRSLVHAGLVDTRRDGTVAFRSAVLRGAIAGRVPEGLRASVHRSASRYYETTTELAGRARLARVAYHAARGGRSELAAASAQRLANLAAATHDYLAAETCYSLALDHSPPDDRYARMACRRGRGLMRYRIGRYQDALGDFRAARDLAVELGEDIWCVELMLDEATALDWMHEYHVSCELVRRARAAAPSPAAPALETKLLLGEGRSLFREAKWAEAGRALDAAIAGALEMGHDGYETHVVALLLLTGVWFCLGDLQRAERVLNDAEEIASVRGDQMHLSGVRANRALVSMGKGDAERAIVSTLECAAMYRELGLLGAEARAEYNAAELAFQAGQVERAWPHIERSIELKEAVSGEEALTSPDAWLLRSRALVLRGDLGEARRCLDDVMRRRASLAEAGAAVPPFLPVDDVLRRSIDLATRSATEQEWADLEAMAIEVNNQADPIEVVEMRGLAALRAGDVERARDKLEQALRMCDRIPSLMEPRIRAHLAALRDYKQKDPDPEPDPEPEPEPEPEPHT